LAYRGAKFVDGCCGISWFNGFAWGFSWKDDCREGSAAVGSAGAVGVFPYPG
jgi:hypothetical protein